MIPITPEIAAACWDAIKDARPEDEEPARLHRGHYEECAVRVRGWVLVPFIDCGDWDYVNSVIAPDGVEYEVDLVLDPDGEGYADTATNKIFNWYPACDRGTDVACCRGFVYGCW